MSFAVRVLLVSIIGYILGSIPTAFILGKRLGNVDIREYGSKNVGASNVTLNFGIGYGAFTLAFDVLKGAAAVWVGRWLVPDWLLASYIAGALAVVGHIYPIFIGFKGGKGAATITGMGLGLYYPLGLLMMGTVFVLALVTNYIAISSIAAFLLLAVVTYLRGEPLLAVLVTVFASALCTYRHVENLRRISQGEEIGVRQALFTRFGKNSHQ